jgi:hypothetical protein
VKTFRAIFALRESRIHLHLRASGRAAISLGVLLLTAPCVNTQTPPKSAPSPASKIAAIKSYRIVQEKDGPAVEILSTQPLVPAIRSIADPDRLVIDLPNARLEAPQNRISVQADQISALRANQFQNVPPIVRVVVDLLAPRTYTWDAAGNRLVIHLGKNPSAPSSSPFQAPTVTSLNSAPAPVVASVRAAGPLSLAANDGSDGDIGSSITAGPDTAVVRLSSGGEVRVCPGTTVSITPSQSRHNLMLSMNAGSMEAHFALDASSDSVMTPDFRIMLVGPGEFHYAFSADPQGNTCVRALPGNTASAIVSELLGDRTYQVKATDQLVFRAGQLDRVDMAVPLECGCPPPRDASTQPTSAPMQSRAPSGVPTTKVIPTRENGARDEAAAATSAPAAAPTGASAAANEVHVQVSAPFVFHATGPPPAPVEDVSALPLDSRPRATLTPALAAPLPPPPDPITNTADTKTGPAAEKPASSRGFFHKLGGFFASLFR